MLYLSHCTLYAVDRVYTRRITSVKTYVEYARDVNESGRPCLSVVDSFLFYLCRKTETETKRSDEGGGSVQSVQCTREYTVCTCMFTFVGVRYCGVHLSVVEFILIKYVCLLLLYLHCNLYSNESAMN